MALQLCRALRPGIEQLAADRLHDSGAWPGFNPSVANGLVAAAVSAGHQHLTVLEPDRVGVPPGDHHRSGRRPSPGGRAVLMLAAAVQELGEAATAGPVVTARARIAQTADSRPILSATPCRLVFFNMAMTSILQRAWRSDRRTQRRKLRSVGSEPVPHSVL